MATEMTRGQQTLLLLSKTGLVDQEGLPTKRTYLILFVLGAGYLFLKLFSWLIVSYGQTPVSLGVFCILLLSLRSHLKN